MRRTIAAPRLAAPFPKTGPALGVRDCDNKNSARLDTVDDSKRKTHNPTFAMCLVGGGESFRADGNTAISSVDRLSKAYGCFDASFGIPVKRIVKVAARIGQQINRQHFATLFLSTDAPQCLCANLLPGHGLRQPGLVLG